MRALPLLLAAGLLLAACEDGPEQIFEPFTGAPEVQNGTEPRPAYTINEAKGFDIQGGDAAGRARFCDETEQTALVQWMVIQPMLPDVGIGGVPLWAASGKPVLADDLVGPYNPTDPVAPTFCDPTGVYLDAFTWGPTDEVIVFINVDTRLVELMIAYQQYLGTLEGTYTTATPEAEHVLIKTRERITFDAGGANELKLDTWAKDDPKSWLNPVNINKIYRMIRETFFGAEAADLTYDCVQRQICEVVYDAFDTTRPQYTWLIFSDTGVGLRMTPDGYIAYVEIDPVRLQQFEVESEISFDAFGMAATMDLGFSSLQVPTCTFNLAEELSWAGFKSRCEMNTTALNRLNYSTFTSREGVEVSFNGLYLDVRRPGVTAATVFRDGEAPIDTDEVFGFFFLRQLNAAVEEFVPSALAAVYETKLEQRLWDAVLTNDNSHPFRVDNGDLVDVPTDLEATPQRIREFLYDLEAPIGLQRIDDGVRTSNGATDTFSGVLAIPVASEIRPGFVAVLASGVEVATDNGSGVITGANGVTGTINYLTGAISVSEGGAVSVWDAGDTVDVEYFTFEERSWIPDVVANVQARYALLSPTEKLALDPRVIDNIFLVEPFVDAVMEAFSHGRSNTTLNPDAFTMFYTPDDRGFSIGYAHYFVGGVPYRLVVQYSVYYNAVTAVGIDRGYSELDAIFNDLNTACNQDLGTTEPYYTMRMSLPSTTLGFVNPYKLGGRGITVSGFDRQLDTLDVTLKTVLPDGTAGPNRTMKIPGGALVDMNGYLKQISGERWEFVPAHMVQMYGFESSFIVYVEQNGVIGYIGQGRFKGSVPLCPGLDISFGDDVRQEIVDWTASVPVTTFRNCELVYNYSTNGNVLDSVASLANKVSIVVVDGRATQANIWR